MSINEALELFTLFMLVTTVFQSRIILTMDQTEDVEHPGDGTDNDAGNGADGGPSVSFKEKHLNQFNGCTKAGFKNCTAKIDINGDVFSVLAGGGSTYGGDGCNVYVCDLHSGSETNVMLWTCLLMNNNLSYLNSGDGFVRINHTVFNQDQSVILLEPVGSQLFPHETEEEIGDSQCCSKIWKTPVSSTPSNMYVSTYSLSPQETILPIAKSSIPVPDQSSQNTTDGTFNSTINTTLMPSGLTSPAVNVLPNAALTDGTLSNTNLTNTQERQRGDVNNGSQSLVGDDNNHMSAGTIAGIVVAVVIVAAALVALVFVVKRYCQNRHKGRESNIEDGEVNLPLNRL